MTVVAPAAPDVSVQNVGIAYGTTTKQKQAYQAVSDVSFEINRNEFVCLLGPSGCGKSSLLMAVGGLVSISGGQISVAGKPINGPGRERAIVFQSASLIPWFSVLKNVEYGLALSKRFPRAEVRERAMSMIKLVGLAGFEDRYPHQLSGGMQQRVNLARAWTADPDLLLMDEPFAALDSQTRDIMQTELLRIWQETRKSVLFVTHQIEEAVYLGDRIIVMSKGPNSGIVRQVDLSQFPRPRTEAMKRSPEFARVVESIWEDIRSGGNVEISG